MTSLGFLSLLLLCLPRVFSHDAHLIYVSKLLLVLRHFSDFRWPANLGLRVMPLFLGRHNLIPYRSCVSFYGLLHLVLMDLLYGVPSPFDSPNALG